MVEKDFEILTRYNRLAGILDERIEREIRWGQKEKAEKTFKRMGTLCEILIEKIKISPEYLDYIYACQRFWERRWRNISKI